MQEIIPFFQRKIKIVQPSGFQITINQLKINDLNYFYEISFFQKKMKERV